MPEPLLDVRALDAFYGDFQALFGVSLRVAPGEVVAVIGANGAGKSTLLNCIAGAIRSRRDAILFDGEPIGEHPAVTAPPECLRAHERGVPLASEFGQTFVVRRELRARHVIRVAAERVDPQRDVRGIWRGVAAAAETA